MVGPPGQVPGGGGDQGRHFPRSGILPELFDGRGCPAEAQGCRVMGDSHDHNILRAPDPLGIFLISQGVPLAVVGNPIRTTRAIGRGKTPPLGWGEKKKDFALTWAILLHQVGQNSLKIDLKS